MKSAKLQKRVRLATWGKGWGGGCTHNYSAVQFQPTGWKSQARQAEGKSNADHVAFVIDGVSPCNS